MTKNKVILNKLRQVLAITACLIIVGALALFSNTKASAAGDAYFTLTPSSGNYTDNGTLSVQVTETSSTTDNVNAVQANLSYPTSLLTYTGTVVNGPFTLVAQNSGGSGSIAIGIASTTAVSGTQNVAEVTFTVNANASGSTSTSSSSPDYFGMTGGSNGSDIDNTSGASVWNGVLPGASFSLSAPVTTPTPTPKPTPTPTPKKTSPVSTGTPTTPAPTVTHPTTTTPTPIVATVSLGSISLRVINSQDKPVAKAKVTLEGSPTEYTNADGVANFTALKSGTYTIKVQGPGVKPGQLVVNLMPGQNELTSLKLTTTHSVWGSVGYILIVVVLLGAAAYLYFMVIRKRPLTPTSIPGNPPTQVPPADIIHPNNSSQV